MRKRFYNQSTAAARRGRAGLCGTRRSGGTLRSQPRNSTRTIRSGACRSPAPVTNATRRKLERLLRLLREHAFPPGERAPRNGMFLPSQAINTVDEVPDSAWYTNRHASRRMTVRGIAGGARRLESAGRRDAGPWSRRRTRASRRASAFATPPDGKYLMKFDPPSNPELASAADVITSKFFYALGYNVPENYVVYFDRSQLAIGRRRPVKDAAGHKARRSARPTSKRCWPRRRAAATASIAPWPAACIAGKPMGPFQYHGTRSDDPNDLVPHEHRRDLRGLRTFAAWLGHDDSKALNTLDMLASEDGTPFIKHYLIDFGASLGSASFMANSPRDGNVYLFDWKSSAAPVLHARDCTRRSGSARNIRNCRRRAASNTRSSTRCAGCRDYPNPAFRNENPADRAWAARKIAAFTDEDIRAIVATGRYTDPAAEEWVARCLIERRNKIVDAFLTGTAALDRFEVRQDRLEWTFAAGSRPRRCRCNGRSSTTRPAAAGCWPAKRRRKCREWPKPGYLVAELTDGRGPAVSVYVRNAADRPFVIGVERSFPNRKAN